MHEGVDADETIWAAVDSDDVPSLIRLLNSRQVVLPADADWYVHPWASRPSTVGSLACFRLAMLAQEPCRRESMGAVGAVPALVNALSSDASDRTQGAVLGLSFLTTDCRSNATAAHSSGALPPLLALLEAEIAGLRSAAATTLRNICTLTGDDARQDFATQDGLQAFVRQLDLVPTDGERYEEWQLEAVLNLQDMIEDEDGTLYKGYARIVKEAGAERKLKRFTKSAHEDLQRAAVEVLDSLSRVDRQLLAR